MGNEVSTTKPGPGAHATHLQIKSPALKPKTVKKHQSIIDAAQASENAFAEKKKNDQEERLGIDLNGGKTMFYNPHQTLSLENSSSSSSSHRRKSTSSSSSTSSNSTISKNRRATLVSSNEILEPPPLASSSEAQTKIQTQSQLQRESRPTRMNAVLREVDFANMHVPKQSGSNSTAGYAIEDGKKASKHQKGKARGLFKKMFKGGKGKENMHINDPKISLLHCCPANDGVMDMGHAAIGSSGFVEAEDYKASYSYHVEDQDSDDSADYGHFQEDETSHHSILLSERLQQEYRLHDNGKLPTILDESYQSSTLNTSVDNAQDKSVNLTNLLDGPEQDEGMEEEEDPHLQVDDAVGEERWEEQKSPENERVVCGTPSYSVVTEEAYDLKSRFSSCTKSINYNGYMSDQDYNQNYDKEHDGLDINESNYTAKLNSLLDKGHASYDAEGEQLGDIQTPMVRLGDLFGDITLNNSKYHNLDTPESYSSRINLHQHGSEDTSCGDGESNPNMSTLDILHETLDEDEVSPCQILKACHDGPVGSSFAAIPEHEDNQSDGSSETVNYSPNNDEKNVSQCSEGINVEWRVSDLSSQVKTNSQAKANNDSNTDGIEIVSTNKERVQQTPNLSLFAAATRPTDTRTDQGLSENSSTISMSKCEDEKEERKRTPVPPITAVMDKSTTPSQVNLLPPLCHEKELNESSAQAEEIHRATSINGSVEDQVSKNLSKCVNELNITEIEVNKTEFIHHQEKDEDTEDSQIGTIIKISKPSSAILASEDPLLDTSLVAMKEKKSDVDDAVKENDIIELCEKDAFTKDAITNANFLFANGPMRIQRKTKIVSKIDEQRIALMRIKEARKAIHSIGTMRSDPLKLLHDAKLELDKEKKLRSSKSRNGKSTVFQIQKAVELRVEKDVLQIQKPAELRVEKDTGGLGPLFKKIGETNSPDESTSKQSSSVNFVKNVTLKKTEKDEEKNLRDISIKSPEQEVNKEIKNDDMSESSPETRDSLEDILEGISPSDLQKRYSAITPMKSFSPFVRFKKAIRLFENEGNTRSVSSKQHINQKKIRPKKKTPVKKKNQLATKNLGKHMSHTKTRTPPKKKTRLKKDASTDKDEFVHGHLSNELEHKIIAPHTLELVKSLFNKTEDGKKSDSSKDAKDDTSESSVKSKQVALNSEIPNGDTTIGLDHAMYQVNANKVNSLGETTLDVDSVSLYDETEVSSQFTRKMSLEVENQILSEVNKQSSLSVSTFDNETESTNESINRRTIEVVHNIRDIVNGNEDIISTASSNEQSLTVSPDVTNASADSPYDEHDELSIVLTPDSDSVFSSSSNDNDSLNTSLYSTESADDIFAALIKKATAATSPDASISSSSSSSGTYFSKYSNEDTKKDGKVILKSAMKEKKISSNRESQSSLHSVRWSLNNLSNEQSNKANTHQKNTQGLISVYDEKLDEKVEKTASPLHSTIDIKTAVNPKELYNFDDSKYDNEASENRNCIDMGEDDTDSPSYYNHKQKINIQYSPVVDISPAPPLSTSIQAAVNPREIYKGEERLKDQNSINHYEQSDGDIVDESHGYPSSPGDYSQSRISITSPRLSNSKSAAVNPRAQKNERTVSLDNDRENEEKENIGIDMTCFNNASSNNSIGGGSRSSRSQYSPAENSMCSYSPLQMSKKNVNINEAITNKKTIPTNEPHSPSALCLSPLQRTPMQARKWRTLAAEAEAKKSKSNKKVKSGRKLIMKRTPLGKIRRN